MINTAGAFLMLIGIIVTGIELHSLNYYKKAPVDINEVYDWRDLEVGSHVEFETNYVWDYAYSNVSSHKVVGVTVDENETSRVYLLPSFYYSTTDNAYYIDSFIGLESHDFKVLDNMVYELDDWYRAKEVGTAFPQDYCKTTYKFDGRIRKANKQEYQLMVDYFVSGGMSEAEAKEMVLPVIIVRLTYSSTALVVGIIMTVLGAIVLAATIISKKKEDADYAKFASSNMPTSVNTVSGDNAPQYYGPEGLSSEVKAERTYQYGGTNTYGTNNVYSSSYQGSGTQIDEESGLSSEFLERMAREKEDRERAEANQRAIEANAAAYAANPLFGNEPAAKPMTASQSFSAYDSVVDKSTFNQNPTNNSGLAVDPSILYGTTPAQPTQPVPPVAPAYEIPQPTYEIPQPTYEAPQPTYEIPQPTYEAPQPVYEAPQPVYEAPQPAYEAPTQFSYQQAPSQYQYNQNPFLGASTQQSYQAAQPTQPVQLPTGGSVAPQALAPSSSPVTLPSGNGIYSTGGNNNINL